MNKYPKYAELRNLKYNDFIALCEKTQQEAEIIYGEKSGAFDSHSYKEIAEDLDNFFTYDMTDAISDLISFLYRLDNVWWEFEEHRKGE